MQCPYFSVVCTSLVVTLSFVLYCRVVTGLEEWPEVYNENPKNKGFDHGGAPLRSLYLEDGETLRVGTLRYVVAQFLSPTLTYAELVRMGTMEDEIGEGG